MKPLNVGHCYSCDKQGIPVRDIFCYDGQSRFCDACIQKFGKDTLRAAANAALAAKNAPPRKDCIKCGGILLVIGKEPMCGSCQREYAARFGGAKIRWH